MNQEELGWNKAAVFICNKCGKSISGASNDLAEDLKKEFKNEMKDMGLSKDIRVMTSGCLNICEKEMQAVAIFPVNPKVAATVTVFNPFKDKEAFRKELLKLKDL